jgi:hypothetical protein
MPSTLFKSRPKSDRRLQWKELKAKNAKFLDAKKIKVEIGLGKALDDHQKQVDRIVLLDAGALNDKAFAPVVASAAAVKKLAVALEPKVKDLSAFTTFLAQLKQDSAWWEKASQEFTSKAGYISQWNADELSDALGSLRSVQDHMNALDTLLKDAGKKTKTYEPPSTVVQWARVGKQIRPQLSKLTLLAKNPTGNFKLITSLLADMEATIGDVRTYALHMTSIAGDNLAPVANWTSVEKEAKVIVDQAHDAGNTLRRFR